MLIVMINTIKMSDRRAGILDSLRRRGRLGVGELARICRCSSPTIRRELCQLEAEGKIIRTHGGCLVADNVGLEGIWQERLKRRGREKQKIAKLAAKRVYDGQVVLLDTGSTVFHVIDYLADRKKLTIVTNFPPLLSRLDGREDWKILMLGGTLRPGRYDLVGPLTERTMEDISADVAFVGADGISLSGPASDDEEVCRIARMMVQSAKEKIVLADASKLARRATFRYAPWGRIDCLITDKKAEGNFVKSLRRKGLVVHLT